MPRHCSTRPIRVMAPLIMVAALAACTTAASSKASLVPTPGATQQATPFPVASTSATPGKPLDWSATRQWIVTQRAIPQGDGAFLVDPINGDIVRLHADLADDLELVHPDWSPDGQSIVYARGGGGPDSAGPDSLWTAAPDRPGSTLVACESPCASVGAPSWSPDGTRIAYLHNVEPKGGGDWITTIQVVTVATGATATLGEPLADGDAYGWFRWSQDGRSLVVSIESYDGQGLTASAIATMSPGSGPRRISGLEAFATYPDWHPADDLIVYSTHDLSAFQSTDLPSNLYLVRPDGTGRKALSNFQKGEARATQPTFTPDGRSVIFTLVEGSGDEDRSVALLDLETLEVTDLGVHGTHCRLRPTP